MTMCFNLVVSGVGNVPRAYFIMLSKGDFGSAILRCSFVVLRFFDWIDFPFYHDPFNSIPTWIDLHGWPVFRFASPTDPLCK